MEGSGAPTGVAGDVPRDDAGASRAVADESFFGRERMIQSAFGGGMMTPVRVYCSDSNSFSVLFGSSSAGFELWTTMAGLDAMIDALLAAKVRASRD